MPTRCKLGAVHTTGLPFAIATVENDVENTKSVENKVLPLKIMLPYLSKNAVAATSHARAHVSSGSSAVKIMRPLGAGRSAVQEVSPDRQNLGKLGIREQRGET
jgi:hypothetical protein